MSPLNSNRRIDTMHILLRKESVYNEAGVPVEKWVAQCLEKDIVSQGDDQMAALLNFQETYIGYLVIQQARGCDLLSDIPMAPKEIWDEFNQAVPPTERKVFTIAWNEFVVEGEDKKIAGETLEFPQMELVYVTAKAA